MGYTKVEAQIIPAKHIVTVELGYSALAVKEAFNNVPNNSVLVMIKHDPVTTKLAITFEEK